MLEIDVQGALKVKKALPEAITIFIAPPNLEALTHRLQNRKTEKQEDIKNRLETAKEELSFQNHYDFVIINDKVEQTVENILTILDQKA